MQRVTLSFDNGPDPDVTPGVLDVLRRRCVTAHFFVVGKRVAEPADRRLVERARDEGHMVEATGSRTGHRIARTNTSVLSSASSVAPTKKGRNISPLATRPS